MGMEVTRMAVMMRKAIRALATGAKVVEFGRRQVFVKSMA
mgnify:CR=1 FL=1